MANAPFFWRRLSFTTIGFDTTLQTLIATQETSTVRLHRLIAEVSFTVRSPDVLNDAAGWDIAMATGLLWAVTFTRGDPPPEPPSLIGFDLGDHDFLAFERLPGMQDLAPLANVITLRFPWGGVSSRATSDTGRQAGPDQFALWAQWAFPTAPLTSGTTNVRGGWSISALMEQL